MTRRIVSESVGTVKVVGNQLRVYNNHEMIAAIVLDERIGHQLIHEINDWLRYPK